MQYDTDIASIPVDNAARTVAAGIAARFPDMAIVVSRDPSHCIDLLSKDLAGTDVVKRVMREAKEVRDFVKIDRIDSIRKEAARDGQLSISCTAISMCETRMNLVHDYIGAARQQHDFMQLLFGSAKFQVYYRERSTSQKAVVDGILDRCNNRLRWIRMDMMTQSLTIHFKTVHGLCSRADMPMAAYPLLVQGLRNDINRGLNVGNGQFDAVLGEGSRREVANMIRERFNMDGIDPSGRKVGLLDRYHLMCLLVDPFSHEWRSTFFVQTNLAVLVNEMMEMYIPLDDNGSSTSRARVKEEFMVRFN